jgi:23S rRNA (guanosine2251-2'-O)-methyltransferase
MNETHHTAGLNSARAALKKGDSVEGVWIDASRRDRRMQEIVDLAEQQRIPIHRVDRKELDKLAPGINHQGVLVRTSAVTAVSEKALPDLIAAAANPLLLILDGVQDPHNLGACLRSADAAGVCAVIAPKDKSVGLTPVAIKVASGAAERVPFVQVTNLARALDSLKEQGVWIVGAAGEAESLLYDIDLKGPIAITMGAEGSGLRRLTREHCDYLARLPMAGEVESLNVSVATGICLFEAVRQRLG